VAADGFRRPAACGFSLVRLVRDLDGLASFLKLEHSPRYLFRRRLWVEGWKGGRIRSCCTEDQTWTWAIIFQGWPSGVDWVDDGRDRPSVCTTRTLLFTHLTSTVPTSALSRPPLLRTYLHPQIFPLSAILLPLPLPLPRPPSSAAHSLVQYIPQSYHARQPAMTRNPFRA
jgi:hypothetical protein